MTGGHVGRGMLQGGYVGRGAAGGQEEYSCSGEVSMLMCSRKHKCIQSAARGYGMYTR